MTATKEAKVSEASIAELAAPMSNEHSLTIRLNDILVPLIMRRAGRLERGGDGMWRGRVKGTIDCDFTITDVTVERLAQSGVVRIDGTMATLSYDATRSLDRLDSVFTIVMLP